MTESTFQFIKDPVMDWTVDDSLNAKFQIWKLKCENILKAEPARCKKMQNSL